MKETVKVECPQCGVYESPADSSGIVSWYCGRSGRHLSLAECRECHRMVKNTWFGLCGDKGCESAPLTPEAIAEARSNLERILDS